jgi:hypothetical protein
MRGEVTAHPADILQQMASVAILEGMDQFPPLSVEFEERTAGMEGKVFPPAGGTGTVFGKFLEVGMAAVGTVGWADEVDAVETVGARVPVTAPIGQIRPAGKAAAWPEQVQKLRK